MALSCTVFEIATLVTKITPFLYSYPSQFRKKISFGKTIELSLTKEF